MHTDADTAVLPHRAISSPLRVLPGNPRYFTDDTGKAMYLTSSHTWANFQDNWAGDTPWRFDWESYLNFLATFNHNFMRLWVWEQSAWAPWTPEQEWFAPLPYARTGAKMALDGLPQFDLTTFNQAYFDRLSRRVRDARERGIYVGIMLFQGWSSKKGFPSAPYDPWPGHPLNMANNINGFDGDKDGDSKVDLHDPAVRALHAAYIRKVIDTVNHLPNVLYEVANEGGNKDWDWFVVRTVHEYQQSKPCQHPVGIIGHGLESTADMLASPADWISPGEIYDPTFKTDPRPWDEGKPSVADTDHIFGIGGDHQLVWKFFLRGHHFIFMDPYDRGDLDVIRLSAIVPHRIDPQYDAVRRAMGHTRRYADKMNLGHGPRLRPLLHHLLPGQSGRRISHLPTRPRRTRRQPHRRPGTFAVEWMHPVTGEIRAGEPIPGGVTQRLTAPFADEAVLYLRRMESRVR